MKDKKDILTLLSHISDGDYSNAKKMVSKIVESKIDSKVKRISKTKRD